ncbi:MAG TPA: RsmB/NOP family class I SAM-dependent RNA methyltransferase [Alphaproteobacteria bacterium]|nr:RsmB/NOP family class I SAM-dependent RNA methyltransferase [Alphaproteobacteria bacterium]
MTPAARIQAAIELLDLALAGERPADRLAADYFRQRRYAGSGDRAAILALLYGALRRMARLRWRCGEAASARALMLGYLRDVEGRTPEQLAALFDGGRFAPAPLDAGEQELLAALAEPPSPEPDWVAGNYPAWLDAALAESLGDAKLAEMQALNEQAPLDLRVNTLKADRETVRRALADEGIEALPGRFSPLCLRLPGRQSLQRHRLFRDGLIEVQDEGSQLIALLTGVAPGETMVDHCAGAGGKTLALAAMMANGGRLIACDAAAYRLGRLTPRLRRAGIGIVEVMATDDPALAEGMADRVLVDAPCSGTGAWRRSPEARWRLTGAELSALEETQAAILARAARLVRPGGRLVYATCSLLRGENEAQVARFLAGHGDFAVLPIAEAWAESIGGTAPAPGDSLHLSPLRTATDGFFVAVLQRRRGGPT